MRATPYPALAALPVLLQPLPSACSRAPLFRPHLLLLARTLSHVQDGEIHVSINSGTLMIPKVFMNQSDESEVAAKELAIKATKTEAKAEAEGEPKKAELTTQKSAAVKQAGTKQKIKKHAATGKQKTAAAPAKKDAPVKRCIVSFPGACVVLVSAALFFAVTMALRGNSSMSTGAAEVVTTKSVSSWADQQCGMHDNDNGFTAVQEAKGFTHNASLDPTASERAGLRVEKEEGVACQPWWLPVVLGAHDGDVDVGKAHPVLASHQSAEQPTPADNPSHAPPSSDSFDTVRPLSFVAKGREIIASWTSSALLCAFLFLLSAYAFNGKVATSLRLRAACTPLRPAPCNTLHLAPLPHPPPFTLGSAPWPQYRTPKKKGTEVLEGKARSPEREVRLTSPAPPLHLAPRWF